MENGSGNAPENKIKSYLGFSLRSGKIVLGTDRIEVLKKDVYLLIADETLGATAKKRLIAASQKLNVALYFYKEKIGELLARPAVKAAALKEKNLAAALQALICDNEMWKIYSGGDI